jgi:hypothetical protein
MLLMRSKIEKEKETELRRAREKEEAQRRKVRNSIKARQGWTFAAVKPPTFD